MLNDLFDEIAELRAKMDEERERREVLDTAAAAEQRARIRNLQIEMGKIRRQLGFHTQCILSMCSAPELVTSLVESLADTFVDGANKQFTDRVDALESTVKWVLDILHGDEDSPKLGPQAGRLLACCEDDVSGNHSMRTLSTYLGPILTIARRVGPQGSTVPHVRDTTTLLTHALHFEQQQLFTADQLTSLGLAVADFGGPQTTEPKRVDRWRRKQISVGAVCCAVLLACGRDENVLHKLDDVADATSGALPLARQRQDWDLFDPWIEE